MRSYYWVGVVCLLILHLAMTDHLMRELQVSQAMNTYVLQQSRKWDSGVEESQRAVQAVRRWMAMYEACQAAYRLDPPQGRKRP